MFAGGTYSTQESFRTAPASKLPIPETGSPAGIAKLTVRPADGHEVKLGTVFPGRSLQRRSAARRAGDPNSHQCERDQQSERHVDLQVRREELHHDARLEIFAAGRQMVRLGCEGLLESHRERPDQDVHTSTTPSAFCGGVPGNAVSGCIGSNRGYQLDTVGVDVHNTTRFETYELAPCGHLWIGCIPGQGGNRTICAGTSDVTTPGGQRTVSGGVRAVEGQLHLAARGDWRGCVTTITSWNRQPRPPAAIACRRRLRSDSMPTAVLTPYASYAEGYRAPSITETLVNGPHAGATPNDSFFRCPSGTPGSGRRSDILLSSNPNLRPEVGKNKEIGFNLKKNGPVHAGGQHPRQVQRVPQRHH